MLHLTNGSVAVGLLRESGLSGDIVAWQDVLHEGPVPAGLGPAALRVRRAAFLAGAGAASLDGVQRELEARDRAIESAAADLEVVLWFEHDLYDQLQLLQVLDRLDDRPPGRVSAPDVPTYIGHLPVASIMPLFEGRNIVSQAQRSAARDAWTAFRADAPHAILDVLPRVTVLPHLAPALERHLQQFPSTSNGLSRTERQSLMAIAAGAQRLQDAFEAAQAQEEARFMGDFAFLHHLSALTRGARPLIRREQTGLLSLETRVALTVDGERVLACAADRVALCGIDRWLGGVHLIGHGPVWRWDVSGKTVMMR
jgi:hypothetical protein